MALPYPGAPSSRHCSLFEPLPRLSPRPYLSFTEALRGGVVAASPSNLGSDRPARASRDRPHEQEQTAQRRPRSSRRKGGAGAAAGAARRSVMLVTASVRAQSRRHRRSMVGPEPPQIVWRETQSGRQWDTGHRPQKARCPASAIRLINAQSPVDISYHLSARHPISPGMLPDIRVSSESDRQDPTDRPTASLGLASRRGPRG